MVRRSVAALAAGLAMLTAACSSGTPAADQARSASSSSSSAPGGSSSGAPVGPQAKAVGLTLTPIDKAGDVAPGEPVTVTATDGKVTDVKVANQDGKPINGTLSADGTKWESSEPLGYSKTYTVNATGQGADGKPATASSTFTTIKPGKQITVSMSPTDGQSVGVGQPLVFYFSSNVGDKAAAEKAISVTTQPSVQGSFYWFRDNEVHWRPREYWKSGTKITVNAAIYGKQLGPGSFGKEDRKANITIGPKLVAVADGQTHQMTVTKDDQLLKTVPISMGKKGHETPNGTYVVMTEQQDYTMDSGTYGVPADSPGGYRTKIAFASRLSNSGIFYHSAPWSVRQQGASNVSHGCINMSTDNAKWMQDIGLKGDIFVVQNSGGPALQSWDGLGDWQIPWDEWTKGGKK
ncbi:L,D-transpeptidase [Actinocrispum wychmicini]|uniref:Lipoprotein-anchoring transpeptidase ErfK/SrfK n=1 Tax=Actinocrispum wychmicini TaxID=1213861 RepID=A0A4R2IMB3_9PSEU|nr:Ig-like domain-containing protein [Actinocrispum wychmicini]TCO45847.1 lipoprotein-anchoring transpeptidase ErfK/SrfK [Actinocrispum wychmicini]